MDQEELNLHLEAGQSKTVIRRLNDIILNLIEQVEGQESIINENCKTILEMEKRVAQLEARNN
jgi:hypothetical protein